MMKFLLMTVALCGGFSFQPSHAQSSEASVVLTWDELEKLEFSRRDEYVQKLAKVFAELKGDVASLNYPPSFALLLSQAQAAREDGYTDIRRAGRTCIYAGNVSTYARLASGNIRCQPPRSIQSLCGMQLKCANAQEVPCNPLLFGFEGDNYANFFTGRVVKADRSKTPIEFEVSGDGTGQSAQIKKSRIYEKPFCVPRSATATKDCAGKRDAQKGHYYGVGYMMADMAKAGCNPGKTWNEFAQAAQKICHRTDNQRQAQLSNKFTECDVIRERAAKLSQEYRTTDVGRALEGESLDNVR